MSYLVFPAFVTNGWNWQWPIKQSPEYKTIEQQPASGRGIVRIPLRQFPLWNFTFDISYIKGDATLVNSYWQILVNFFMAVQGKAANWLFAHPFDGNVTNQFIGNTAASGTATQTFGVYRTLVTNGAADLIQNFQGTPTFYVNGVAVPTVNRTIDQYGTLSWVSYTPAANKPVTWTGSFYYLCHFTDDTWGSLEEQLNQIWANSEMKFQSQLN